MIREGSHGCFIATESVVCEAVFSPGQEITCILERVTVHRIQIMLLRNSPHPPALL